MPRPNCSKCGEQQCSRTKRVGLWQRFILPRFGRFPWQCSSCGKIFLVKERGKSKRRRFEGGQIYTPWQPGQPLPIREDDLFHGEQHDQQDQ